MKTTKSVYVYSLIIAMIMIMFAGGCKKDKDSSGPADLTILDVSQESNWSYMAIASNGSNVMVKAEAGAIKEIFYRPSANFPGYSIMLNAAGKPEKAVINNNIFLLGNYSMTKVDVAVVMTDGTIKVLRELETGVDVNLLSAITITDNSDFQNMMKLVGHSTSMTAGAMAKAAVPANGISLSMEAIGSGSSVLGMVTGTEITKSKVSALNESSMGSVSAVAGCSSADVACIVSSVGTATSIVASSYALIQSQEENVNTAEGVLQGGYGDIQVNLTWSTLGDVDLWVTDPNGETINWGSTTSSSGGYLDQDNTEGYGPENVFWAADLAPAGTYQVTVDYYSGSGPTTYAVMIILGDVVQNNGQPYTGTINPDENIVVTEFTFGSKSQPVFLNKKTNLTKPRPIKMNR